GAALYRAGRFEDAVKRLGEACRLHAEGGTAWDWLFLAMAEHRLGHDGAARGWLDKAARWIDQRPKEAAALAWYDRVELQLLREGAAKLLTPGARLARDQAGVRDDRWGRRGCSRLAR